MIFRALAIGAVAISLTGCVSTRTISEKQIGDSTLACAEIADRVGELNALKAYSEKESGVSGKNVAAALFFWPAIIGNQMNAGDNIESINKRKTALIGHYESRNCSDPVPNYSVDEIKTRIKNNTVKELQE